jgi:hypothetical protein
LIPRLGCTCRTQPPVPASGTPPALRPIGATFRAIAAPDKDDRQMARTPRTTLAPALVDEVLLARLVDDSRAAQGLGPTVTEPDVVRALVRLLREPAGAS